MLDFERVGEGVVNTTPFPYMVVEDVIVGDQLPAVVRDFPQVRHPGSIPLGEARGGAAFARLVADLNSARFRQLMAAKFALDLADKPVLTTVRGVMRAKDGCAHTDSATKVLTVLVYFNQSWHGQDGCLRILRSGDLEDWVAEIPPRQGTMVAFAVTKNCWHGHKPVVGRRLSLQMNYLSGSGVKYKHQFFHGLSARLKQLAP